MSIGAKTRTGHVMRAIQKDGISQSLCTHYVVPGIATRKPLLFLLVLPLAHNAHAHWLRMLQELGFAGSQVLATPNFPAAEIAIESEALDAIVMWDADFAKKRYRINELQTRMRSKGSQEIPFFVFEDSTYPERANQKLAEFLAQHCPR